MKETFIRAGITAEGYKTALRDYNDASPIEELAANSYDADAKTFFLAADFKTGEIHIFDDGTGFEPSAFEKILTLGQGTKTSIDHSRGDRLFLGSYGFGFKSTVNLAKESEIVSFNKGFKYSTRVNWDLLEKNIEDENAGFSLKKEKSKPTSQGTYIKLILRNAIEQTELDKYKKYLSNLPQDNGKFLIYIANFSAVRKLLGGPIEKVLKNLKKIGKSSEKKGRATKVTANEGTDLDKCTKKNFLSKHDKNVKGVCYFTGFEKGKKVKPLSKTLRGIYVRVHGRLLKKDFSSRQFTQPIHRWVSFESGLRVEISIDWVADQLSLSRGDVIFKNKKIENDFRANLQNILGQSLRPLIQEIEKTSRKQEKTFHGQRQKQAEKRVKKHKDVLVPTLKTGFNFKPESDAELALIFCQTSVLSRALPNHRLIDYNASGSFDCLLHDDKNLKFINCELEPRLEIFLTHKRPEKVELVVSWSRGSWKIGSRKKGRCGAFELANSQEEGNGRYRLLEYSSLKSNKPRKEIPAIILEEICK